MVLVLARIEPSVIRASQDLGAGFWTTLRRIVLPLAMPGVIAGFLFVFVVALGTSTEIQLHPAARNIRIEATEGGRLTVTAITSPVGPGYHTYVIGLLRRMGEELDVEWLPAGAPEDADASSDVTGFFESADRADAERGHLTWLHRGLLAARDARQRGATAIHLETPPGARYTFSGAIATVLGPRSEEWLDRAIAAAIRLREVIRPVSSGVATSRTSG